MSISIKLCYVCVGTAGVCASVFFAKQSSAHTYTNATRREREKEKCVRLALGATAWMRTFACFIQYFFLSFWFPSQTLVHIFLSILRCAKGNGFHAYWTLFSLTHWNLSLFFLLRGATELCQFASLVGFGFSSEPSATWAAFNRPLSGIDKIVFRPPIASHCLWAKYWIEVTG